MQINYFYLTKLPFSISIKQTRQSFILLDSRVIIVFIFNETNVGYFFLMFHFSTLKSVLFSILWLYALLYMIELLFYHR